jgi:hypothetical protein
MGSWTRDQDGNWTDETAEIDRDDQARKDWKKIKREEEDFIRRHQEQPALQIIPTEQDEEKPRTPTPDEIQKIIDELDIPTPPKPRTPYLN